jgi:anti-sigma regulatory factor (Ser/Thr protein kinase)
MYTVSIRVDGPDQAAEARRRAAAVAAEAGLDEIAAGRLAIVVTELANNIWRHGGGGEMLISDVGDGSVEALALDSGPGMPDIGRCFQDGYSTAGSAGTGLGALKRLSTEFDIYSLEGKGTAVLSRIRAAGARPPVSDVQVGGVSVPMRGEKVCGDSFACSYGAALYLMVVDGLGHGPGAADCASAAVEAFAEAAKEAPADILQEIHAALRATRGAAASVARIDFRGGALRYAGIGNIAGLIWSGGTAHHMVSHPGIVGHNARTVTELTYALPPDALVLLYSDGIATHWSLSAYEGLLLRDPSLVAGVIYRDQSRGRDDATVVVVRSR